MTDADRRRGDLVQVLMAHTIDERQSINAVYYLDTQLSARIASFLDFVGGKLREAAWAQL